MDGTEGRREWSDEGKNGLRRKRKIKRWQYRRKVNG